MFTAVLIPVINEVAKWSYIIHNVFNSSFFALQAAKFALCVLILHLPTVLFGAIFPLVSTLYMRDVKHVANDIGKIYFTNTLGSTLGSFLAGFLLIPLLGIQKTVILACGLNLLVGNVLVLRGNRWKLVIPTLSVLFLAIFSMAFGYNKQLLTSGVYLYSYGADIEAEVKKRELLFYKEGISCVVSVHADQGIRFVRVNGKTDASTGADMITQTLLGHLTMLLADEKDRVAVIGMGSGVTVAAVAKHNPRELYVLEIEKEMLNAAAYFSDVNNQVLDNKNIKYVITDGRHFIQSSTRQFDVIISEPSNPWIAGIGSLFSDDFYKMAYRKLRDNGIFVQWVHSNYISSSTFNVMLKTFILNFPNASLWECSPGHYMMIGRKAVHEQALDPDKIRTTLEQNETISQDLRRIGIADSKELLNRRLLSGADILAMSAEAPVNTDDMPILEYLAPRALNFSSNDQVSEEIHRKSLGKY